ncbi:transketolase [Aureibacillus halotolerans]|uniref:Transketolase n=1 Tax=Aureibacillus halotolerans TaxID=1508390 RepID=A0A4R6TTG7_9BACI|nr:transketolase [Aureibacillus halotolerans]TDQ33767.1 transketolase [Aureibacillus halotolerans]
MFQEVNELQTITELKRKATEIRINVLDMIYEAGAGHLGGSLSITDLLTALYYHEMNVDPLNPQWSERDRYVQSKGHSVESYWAVLAEKGFFPKEDLKTFSQFGTKLIGHPNNKVPGVEMNTGALGHGLSVAVGMAIAGKLNQDRYRVFTIMGDGEQTEGSIWEAAMTASHYKLDHLVAIIDRNRLQITGDTEDVMAIEPLADKWRAFGWHVVEIDGHDMESIVQCFRGLPFAKDKPNLIIAHTVKGKGISFAENKVTWHHKVPSKDEYQEAINTLKMQLEVL